MQNACAMHILRNRPDTDRAIEATRQQDRKLSAERQLSLKNTRNPAKTLEGL
jgi:hypothetical protein